MPRISRALLRYYEYDDKNELIRYTLHAYSQPSKSQSLRDSLCLEKGECEEIEKRGMVEIRGELVGYMDAMDAGGKFCILNALYANGICCRNCMSVCHKIPYWVKLNDEQKEKFVGRTMKWIEKKVNESEL